MGRPGSDQSGLARKMTGNWGKENVSSEGAGFCDSAVLSIRRAVDSNDKNVHVVEYKLATLRRSIAAYEHRFFGGSPDDPDGRASALQFACTMDFVPACMSYLLGKSGPPNMNCWLEWKMLLSQLQQFARTMDFVPACMSYLLGKSETPNNCWLEWKMLLSQL